MVIRAEDIKKTQVSHIEAIVYACLSNWLFTGSSITTVYDTYLNEEEKKTLASLGYYIEYDLDHFFQLNIIGPKEDYNKQYQEYDDVEKYIEGISMKILEAKYYFAGRVNYVLSSGIKEDICSILEELGYTIVKTPYATRIEWE